MAHYANQNDIETFLKELGPRPLFVCDMDGNVMLGYNAKSDLPLTDRDNPQTQSIPFGASKDQIAQWTRDSVLEPAIFADKPMDVRLPPALVSLLNDFTGANAPFRLAFLTSRGYDDARTLLEESGARNADQVTLVADSGATLHINGTRHDARPLTETESSYLRDLDVLALSYREGVKSLLQESGFDPENCPPLRTEHKGIATNIHYREILSHYGQQEGSELDQNISSYLKARLQQRCEEGPREESGAPTFKTLDGPATVEMKLASINKGHGLLSIVREAMREADAPTAVIFTGDDVSKGNGTPGTDYYAMLAAESIAHEFGIPVHNVHTHHPVGNDLYGETPDPNKSPDTLSDDHPAPPIRLRVATPIALGGIILQAFGKPALTIAPETSHRTETAPAISLKPI